MTDKEKIARIWKLFDQSVHGLDSKIIAHLMSHHSVMAGEGEVTPERLWREFVAIDNLLEEIRDLVRPFSLNDGYDFLFPRSESHSSPDQASGTSHDAHSTDSDDRTT